MMTKTVVVMYKGEKHTVDVPCEPNTSFERCKELAIEMLKRKDEIRLEINSARIKKAFGFR